MDEFERGNKIRIKARFTSNIDDAQPSGASVTISYRKETGGAAKATATMTSIGDGFWAYDWDSSVAARGIVDYAVKSSGPVVAAKQGSFMLLANSANT